MADKVIDSLVNRQVWSFDKEVITRLFLYRPYIKPSVDKFPRLHLGRLSTLMLDIRADMKTAMW